MGFPNLWPRRDGDLFVPIDGPWPLRVAETWAVGMQEFFDILCQCGQSSFQCFPSSFDHVLLFYAQPKQYLRLLSK